MFSYLVNIFGIIYHWIFKNNKIFSLHTHYNSLSGYHTRIQSGSHIDKHSEIGSYTYIGHHCFITKAKIGHYCSIANNVSIGQGEHNLNKISTSSIFYENPFADLTSGDCIIENDVWIGVDAIILRGVKLSTGSVVAANAVVTSDVPPYAVVAGVPARIIKYRFSYDVINKLIGSQWWCHNLNRAKYIQEKLYSELDIK